MRVLSRLVATILALALAGGAQACVALCAAPAQAARPAAEKTSCHRCGDKPARHEPATPCKHCQTASQDRLTAERDQLQKAGLDLSYLPTPEIAPLANVLRPAADRPRLVAHGPPGDLLHQFCILLI